MTYIERHGDTITYWLGGPPSRSSRIRWWTVHHLMPWRRIRS